MKKILISGAGSGLGRGTATGPGRAGHQIIATIQIWPQVTELRSHTGERGLTDRITGLACREGLSAERVRL